MRQAGKAEVDITLHRGVDSAEEVGKAIEKIYGVVQGSVVAYSTQIIAEITEDALPGIEAIDDVCRIGYKFPISLCR